jgi:26S proteasome regulatory subunit N3
MADEVAPAAAAAPAPAPAPAPKDKDAPLEPLKETLVLRPPKAAIIPEVQVYMELLLALFLLDRGKAELTHERLHALVDMTTAQNRRTLDFLTAKVFSYYLFVSEKLDRAENLRTFLQSSYAAARHHHDEPTQAVLVNALLRDFLKHNLYAQADKFRLSISFPEARAGSQHARYLYYLGRINATQLQYSDALSDLKQASRKAPQIGAVGFRQTVTKLQVIVQLLLGEIPDRTIFHQPGLRRSLRPYLQMTQAVRIGDLAAFKEVVARYRAVFLRDGNFTLIERLRFNVIKAGLRKLSLSYSRLSLDDVAAKLHLESAVDAEYIVAKAIRDGVIDAVIDRKTRIVESRDIVNVYATSEPTEAFHKRIQLCMDIHNTAVKSLRFPAQAQRSADAGTGSDIEDEAYED